ncbi:Mu-like prophage major head subunit gpT family protein [Pluralibacter gergoviae]|uniref:Mu-like prophage major head subunit gpT family protein n=1 Tax=Pluralibacter gergoviae TaxID=61647 RepID=A0AAI9DJT6_PLUGE|nr:Mu-like prophage major head subunit gpT family protein [Pluralibacter gergoviae]EKX1466777.1 Mu-like prophage major head subunit gpT family protein [Klebsiella pneumoniae]EKV0914955.1 Mu-like prophage major head subunit gpT family protein [Pluralibacter gergoviae]EKV9909290.1 Mu-like prophage major head subunit gpT family protein [Pluralibacter gergoviae]EKW7273112.1 Mu-like prophage major head subunit gpT family protein [Pluralibacter gergoviae]EKW9973968.1 Mu-like prophage major head subu
MPQPSAEILHALSTSLSAAFTKGLAGVTPQYLRIATVVPSSAASNTYGWLSELPGIKEWVGERQLVRLSEQGYTITNKTWESSIRVKRESIEDDQIGQYSVIAQAYGKQVSEFPDTLSFPMLVAGFSTLCFDGQNFFDTDHPMAGGTYSNIVGDVTTDAGEPWFLIDESQVLKPILYQDRRAFDFKSLDDLNSEHTFLQNEFLFGVDGRCNVGFGFWQTAVASRAPLNAANYEAAVKVLQGMKRDSGLPLGIRPTTLVVGPNNRAPAKRVIDAMLVDGGNSNIYYKDVEIVDSPFITTPAAPAP